MVRREEPVAVSRGNEARMLFEAWFGLVWGGGEVEGTGVGEGGEGGVGFWVGGPGQVEDLGGWRSVVVVLLLWFFLLSM